MSSFRRWYFYVVSAISLQAVTWAVIALLRNLLAPALNLADPGLSPEAERIAFQISVIIIGLPMFLLHWHWAGRPAAEDGAGDQELPERAIYLYYMAGAFLIPLLSNANGFFQSLLRLASGTPAVRPLFTDTLPDRANLVYTAVAIFVLALMLLYHAHLLRQDRRVQPPSAISAAFHRLFIYLFSAAGLVMTSYAAANLLQWLQFAAGDPGGPVVSRQLIDSIAAALVGLPLWLFFWHHAQQLFRTGGPAEQESILRKAYLYLTIFLAVVATIGAATALLAGLFRRLFGLDPQPGSGVVFSTLIVGAIVWAYHALVLRDDTGQVPVQAEQAGLRRLYWYLVAGAGLLALLIGLGGVLGILFDPGSTIVNQQRDQLAWSAALLLAGLLVWLIPWRKIQQETDEPALQGASARASLVRRFYLFFFLLLATLTFLIAAIYILSRLLTAVLGQPLQPEDLRTMGLAAAYAIMAAAVWLYHGRLLQQDQQAFEKQQQQRASELHIVVVDDGRGTLGRALLDSLQNALPGSHVTPIGLSAAAAEAMGAGQDEHMEQQIAAADIIIGPWSIAAPAGDKAVQAAMAASPARKLILPSPAPGWQWASKERWRPQTAVREATEIVQEIAAGEEAISRRISAPAMILFLIAATFLILILIASLLESVIPLF